MPTAPVVMFLFNRPDFTQDCFARIARVRPQKLFLIADGPRHERDRALCQAAREAVAEVTWPCEIHRNYSDSNLGCYQRVVTGLNWVFSQTESAIILEDDMLPDDTLFPFVTELLERYRHNDRIFAIGGMSIKPFVADRGHSYSFSNYALTWGWGTWARAWRLYDGRLERWAQLRDTNWLEGILKDRHAVDFYRQLFDAAAAATTTGRYQTPWGGAAVDAWDYQWHFTMWLHNACAVIPSRSLVRNQGFRADSTNVSDPNNDLALVPADQMSFPLTHPSGCELSHARDADLFAHWQGWRLLSIPEKLWFRASQIPWLRAVRRAF